MTQFGYLAAPGFEIQLERELKNINERYGRLFIAEGPLQEVYWAQNIWFKAQRLKAHSISEAAKQLRAIQRNWHPYFFNLPRRAKLIQEKLPYVSAKRIPFLADLPVAPLGSWTLVDAQTLIASPECQSPFPNGQVEFAENKDDPPSRAYLKLWELFTLTRCYPEAGDVCLELGASPGGWTWVLTKLGAQVYACDRAPLAETLQKSPLVKALSGDAFTLHPRDYPQVQWLFSDLICYPEKMWNFLQPWLEAAQPINFVITIKFQGESHYSWISKFASIPGSQIFHLSHNKHELTWMLLQR